MSRIVAELGEESTELLKAIDDTGKSREEFVLEAVKEKLAKSKPKAKDDKKDDK